MAVLCGTRVVPFYLEIPRRSALRIRFVRACSRPASLRRRAVVLLLVARAIVMGSILGGRWSKLSISVSAEIVRFPEGQLGLAFPCLYAPGSVVGLADG